MQSELERILRATAHRFPDPDDATTTRARVEVLRGWRSLRAGAAGTWGRRGTLLVAVALAVAASFGVGKMTAASPPPISVQPQQLAVARGTHVVFSGRVPSGSAGDEITVFASHCGDDGFVEHRRLRSGAGGRFSATVGPVDRVTEFRFASGDSRSGAFTIGARPLVTLERDDGRDAFRVSVYGGEGVQGGLALLQRFNRARAVWATVARVRLARDVGFVSGDAAVRARPGQSFRALLRASGPCLSQSVSSVMYVNP